MTELSEQEKKIQYEPPHIIEWKPKRGEYITRAVGDGMGTLEWSYDPESIQSGITTKKYARTALHPIVQPPLNFIKDGPFWSEWKIVSSNDYDMFPGYEDIDKRLIDCIYYQIDRMRFETFTNTVKSIFEDSIIHGYSVAEKNFMWDGQWICLESIKTHSPFLFDIYTDKGHNIDYLYYTVTGQRITREILQKFVVATFPYVRHGRHYGTSLLQSIYWDIEVIKALEQAYDDGMRRLAIKPILHTYLNKNLSGDELIKVREALRNLESADVISTQKEAHPERGEVERHTFKVLEDRASPEGVALLNNRLEGLYKRINRTLGLPDDLGYTQTVSGSYAKSKTEMSLFMQPIVKYQMWIQDMVNRKIIPSMLKYNYPSIINNKMYHLPEFRFDSVEEDYDFTVVQTIREMIDSGILSIKYDLDHIRQKLKLPSASPEMIQDYIGKNTIDPKQPELQELSITERNKLIQEAYKK